MNRAARLILRQVSRGRMGRYVVMMDTGREELCVEDELEVKPRHIPIDILPPNIPEKDKKILVKHSRPDAFLYKPATKTKPAEYIIIEVKYCRDSDPQGQLERAEEQHRALADALERASQEGIDKWGRRSTVKYIPIILGVSGAIYKSTVHHMKPAQLGHQWQGTYQPRKCSKRPCSHIPAIHLRD